ncbi:hypothetical protein B5X24_HaOG203178 [Helicoverpa armigera]|uniref:Uncharacterized protein n=1 Tax=Helicoverpa armigera TaxID=29058 RepID=A0A2W1BV82_HELAM|nr:hypothetical protein B5X24_HaOG203178 [Helicoverpa armigera]
MIQENTRQIQFNGSLNAAFALSSRSLPLGLNLKNNINERLGDLSVKPVIIPASSLPSSEEETTVVIGPPPGRQEYFDNVEEVLEFLKELDQKFGQDSNNAEELRCARRSCSRSRDDRNDLRCLRNDLRCMSCGRSRDDRNDRNDLRCMSCGRSRDDRNDLRCMSCGRSRDDRNDDRDDSSRSIKDLLRCIGANGNRCGLNADNRDDRDNLRCSGTRCGRSREDLRCIGERCSLTRSADNHELCIGDRCNIRDDQYRDDIDNLRCSSNKCSVDSDNYNVVRVGNLRCSGRRCAVARYGYNDDNKSPIQSKRYRVAENLDAIIVDLADLERLQLNQNVQSNKLPGAKILENVDLDNLLVNANDRNSNVEAAVYDLESRNDRNALTRQLKRLLSQGIEIAK